VSALAMMNALEARGPERRRHCRVKVRLGGKFMLEDRREFPCVTIDISPGGIAFAAEESAGLGETVVAYLGQIGRVQGIVRRQFDGGFAISMKLPPLKREKLAEQLTWLINRRRLGLPEDRRHERIQARHPHTTLTLPSGRECLAKIIDFSRSGAALSVAATPDTGAAVTVGLTRADVVRLFPGGVAVEFVRMIPEGDFSEDYRL
jgi:PilZ domain